MEHCTRKAEDEKAIPEFGPDTIEMAMRARVRETIEAIVEEELDAALGARRSARVRQIDETSGEWRGATIERYQRRTRRVDAAILGIYLSPISGKHGSAVPRRCFVNGSPHFAAPRTRGSAAARAGWTMRA